MEEGNNTVYLVAGYEISDEEQTTLLQESAFNKYHTIAKSGLTAALKEYYAAYIAREIKIIDSPEFVAYVKEYLSKNLSKL